VIEKIIKFDRELSVICSRNIKKNICFYPPFENIHKNHILFETISPSQIDEKINKQLIIISKKILNKLNYIGLLTIEFFLDDENNIYVNEIAPRVHNSGHITLDNANMSQFELHIKAITKDKIKTPKIIKKGLMRNLIGNEIKRIKQISKLKSYKVYKKKKAYDYGKKAIKQGRKMGHINFVK
jgi:Phosphoribosylaminoimidazole carboxylase (NCAIR synthetase)